MKTRSSSPNPSPTRAATRIALAALCTTWLAGCADIAETARLQAKVRTMEQSGVEYAEWLEVPAGTWAPGSAPGMPNLWQGTGNLFVDFPNRHASGSGTETMLTSGLGSRVVWNINAMRVVKVRWTNVNPIAGLKMAEEPLKVVFEGHFVVHPIRGGKETGETIVGKSAIVTGVSNGTYRQLTMTLIPQGVEVRDGFAVEGIVPIGALIFH